MNAPISRGAGMPNSREQGAGSVGHNLLFLREEQIRLAQDMLFLAWRDFSAVVDPTLSESGLGRAHHRALHFIGRMPGLTVTDLLSVLCITKQSLARVLGALIDAGFVSQTAGRQDRRQRLLRLTDTGLALERRLFERQRELLLAAFRDAGGPSVEGFSQVLRAVMSRAGRSTLEELRAAPAARRV